MSENKQNISSIPNPFLEQLGIISEEMADGRAKISLDLQDAHMNSWQITHGGVLMSMLDVVMAMAGRSLHDDQKGVVTVEMKTTFLQPGGVTGARLEARGHAYHQSATMCFCDGEIWCGDKLVAKANATYKYLRSLRAKAGLQRLGGSD
ncbi:PaaI family thioesterase [Undibacterium cyanobacteriorum]|uniref:PaaI family thioesterase n=1 Tax=Undibacterium cyanobacteriorum TaxID=3073561 RepID=A0ABY9RDH7_9BURK|nr:PaaI family thioesterase [Undibacterium sp. 20NA77.5]WMW78928.1 PaaI family thioesterase [Undibacterium sp. 20NA77.5]